jgi:hypothetical protein
MTVIDALHTSFKTCPAFAGKRLDIDCLQSKPDYYSLDSIPGERIVKRYLDGGTVRRQLCTISSRADFGPDLAQQRENLEVFETLEGWLDAQETLGRLPDLGPKRRARSLRVTSTAYPMEAEEAQGGGTARYQIQMELIYLQEV